MQLFLFYSAADKESKTFPTHLEFRDYIITTTYKMCIKMSGKCSHVLSYIGCMGIIIRAHTQYKLRVHVYD